MALWTPEEIATRIWLDFADTATVTTVSGAVSAIADKSGNGINATQGVAAARPAYTSSGLNGLHVATFDGLNDWLDLAENSWAISPCSSYVVFRTFRTSGESQFSFSARDPNRWYPPYIESGNFQFRCQGSSILFAANTSANLHGLVSGPAGVSAFVNGSLVGTGSAPTGSFSTTGNSIGSYSNGIGSFLRGYVAEIILCQVANTIDERQLIEGYLAWKWGFQVNLPNNHPYKNAAPTKAGGLPIIVASHYAALGI